MSNMIRVVIDVQLEKEVNLDELASKIAARAHTLDGVANAWEISVGDAADSVLNEINEHKADAEAKAKSLWARFKDWIRGH